MKPIIDVNGIFSLLGPWSPVATWCFALVVLGAFLLLASFLPGFIAVVKTKNTASMSILMWILSVAGLAFLSLFYLLGCISTADSATSITGVKLHVPAPHFLIVFLCEFISLILSIYILFVKITNSQKAKKMGISEAEYCASLNASKKK